MTPAQLTETLRLHDNWMHDPKTGERAELFMANLPGAVMNGEDLTAADLTEADLTLAVLTEADLTLAVLRRACLVDAVMNGAVLSQACMTDADLTRTVLRGVCLFDAVLTGAVMTDTDLTDANMAGTVMTDASMAGTVLTRANLHGVIGNMREVKSAQIDRYPLAWIMAGDVPILQIGCQQHTLQAWSEFDEADIHRMDHGALDWWSKHKSFVLGLVEQFPATPTKPWETQ